MENHRQGLPPVRGLGQQNWGRLTASPSFLLLLIFSKRGARVILETIQRTAAPLRLEVVASLRRAIITSEYSHGERLVETALCDKFSVSRTVVREALRQLESEQLVVTVPNRGPEVATLTPTEARNLYEVRGALESLAGSLFAERATEVQRGHLVARLFDIRRAAAAGGAGQLLAAKDSYYEVLLAGAGNEEISGMLRQINARTQVLRALSTSSPGRSALMLSELTDITASAAIARDPEAARLACVVHAFNAAEAAFNAMGAET